MLTLTLYPLVLVAFIGITIASGAMAPAKLLPIAFALLALVVADVATRDARANTLATLRATPRLRENFVWWKFGSTLLLSFALCAAPIGRTATVGVLPLCALLGGIVFRCRAGDFARHPDRELQDVHRYLPQLLVSCGE